MRSKLEETRYEVWMIWGHKGAEGWATPSSVFLFSFFSFFQRCLSNEGRQEVRLCILLVKWFTQSFPQGAARWEDGAVAPAPPQTTPATGQKRHLRQREMIREDSLSSHFHGLPYSVFVNTRC